jgi:hypothetical protein
MQNTLRNLALLACGMALIPRPAEGQEVALLAARIKAVEKEGQGNEEAARAWNGLVRLGPAALVPILAEMDGSRPVAANWLRAAVDTIAERAVKAEKQLPAPQLEAFIRERRHDGQPRRLAYDWLVRIDSAAPGRLLPEMLDDPSAELRRDAVALVLKEAKDRLEAKDEDGARKAYRKALEAARDIDQVKLIAGRLKGLGQEVDLTRRFGFLTEWMIVGPFDNSGGAGYSKVFPPEKGVDLKMTFLGKGSAPLRWQRHVTTAPLGLVDLNQAIGKLKGVTAYALATVVSSAERTVEIRAASNNAVRIYLNGQEVFGREEYHHGMRMDQHVGRGVLKAGRNEILVKVCQNEQTETWAESWSLQVRLCDAIGGRIPLTVVVHSAAGGR